MNSETQVQRNAITTGDPEQARELLHRTYGPQLRVGAGADTDWGLKFASVQTPQFSVVDMRLPPVLTYGVLGHQDVVIGAVQEGFVGFEDAQGTHRFVPGDIFCQGPGLMETTNQRLREEDGLHGCPQEVPRRAA